MDYHQYQQQEESSNNNNNTSTNNNNTSVGGGNVVESKSSFLCRQSSTRWIPTGEQVRILRDLYYNCGVRSPSAEQIQKISARLRQYGKIEGKNVFYWFQNHKARERQKRRLTVDVPNSTTTTKNVASGPCSSPGLYGGGQMGSSTGCGGGSVLMERSFGESWVSGGGDGSAAAAESNMGWVGYDPATPWMYHYAAMEQETTATVAVAANREIETLPLFPIYSQEQEQQNQEEGYCSHLHQTNGYFPAFYLDGGGRTEEEEERRRRSSAASLELSLSSYYYDPQGST